MADKQKHVVIVGEGGGAKMPLISSQIEYIEEALNKPITEIADLAVTTSASAVVFSILTTQRMRAKKFNELLLGKRGESDRKTASLLKKIFTPRGLLSVPRYDRDEFIHVYNQQIGDPIYMRESLINFILTSVNECDAHTHFFKSWEEKDGKLKMTEAACRSFAAMYYFGEMIDEKEKALWTDGGVGIFNLPLMQAYAQARVNGWLKNGHHTHILAICGGYSDFTTNFTEYKKRRSLGRVIKGLEYFINPGEGGGARAMSALEQINWLNFMKQSYDGVNDGLLTFQSTNWANMPAKLDSMNNWEARWQYYDKGMEIAKTIDLGALKKS